jgi:hypothetical protein
MDAATADVPQTRRGGAPVGLGARDAAGQPASPASSPDEPAADVKAGKTLRALRVDQPPQIDGQLDDDAWRRAEAAEGLVQWEPDNMAPLSEQTTVQVAYDDRHLYVAVRCHDREPAAIEGP